MTTEEKKDAAAPPKEEEKVDFGDVFGKKKRKKKKVTIADGEEAGADDQEKEEKKVAPKKEDKKEATVPEEEDEDVPVGKDEDESGVGADLKFEEDTTDSKAAVEKDTGPKVRKELVDFPSFTERDYTYTELVSRLFSLTQKTEEKTTVKIKPPIVYKEGTTRTAWVNFPQICVSINRQPEHVLSFVLAEVASTGSLDGNGRLLIRGRFQQKHMERILRHYIVEYVQCHTCKSLETKLQKENRLLFMKCDTCGSTRSVAQIKTGFQATTRASRRTAQNKQT